MARGMFKLLFAVMAFSSGAAVSWLLVPALLAGAGFSQPTVGMLYVRTFALTVVVAVTLLIFSGRRTRYLLPVGGAFLVGLNAWGLRLPRWEDLKTGAFHWEGLEQLPGKVVSHGNAWLAVICLGIGLCLLYVLYIRLRQFQHKRLLECAFLIGVTIFGAVMFQGFAQMSPLPHDRIVADQYATSFYTAAREIDTPREFMTTFIDRRDEYPLHAASNMPGKTLIFYFFARILGFGPGRTAHAIQLLAALAAVPLYFLIRQLIDRKIAAGAAVLYLFIPGLSINLPLMNTVTPLFVFFGALLALWWMRPAGAYAALLKGIALGAYVILLTLYEPVPLVLTLLLLPYLVRLWRENRSRWGALAGAALGMTALFLILYWYVGGRYSLVCLLLDTYRRGMAFNVEWGARPYLPHVLGNLSEFATGLGLAAAVLAVGAVLRGARDALAGRKGVLREFHAGKGRGAVFAVTFAATVLVLDLSGVNRGEVTRLWIFLMPFAIAAALWFARRLNNRWAVPILGALLLTDNFLLRFCIPPPGF